MATKTTLPRGGAVAGAAPGAAGIPALEAPVTSEFSPSPYSRARPRRSRGNRSPDSAPWPRRWAESPCRSLRPHPPPNPICPSRSDYSPRAPTRPPRRGPGPPLGAPRWGLWEAGRALVTLGRPPLSRTVRCWARSRSRRRDLIIIPALAASVDGTRLGQGGGWYDRALVHRRPGTPVVATIFDDEVLEAGVIPAEPHDVPVDAIITPTRTIATNVRSAFFQRFSC